MTWNIGDKAVMNKQKSAQIFIITSKQDSEFFGVRQIELLTKVAIFKEQTVHECQLLKPTKEQLL